MSSQHRGHAERPRINRVDGGPCLCPKECLTMQGGCRFWYSGYDELVTTSHRAMGTKEGFQIPPPLLKWRSRERKQPTFL